MRIQRSTYCRLLLCAALALALLMRFWGLKEQGPRLADEGRYYFFGACLKHGLHGQIYGKPGHALLVALGYRCLGFSMAAPLFVSAALGMVSVVLAYGLARRLWSEEEGITAAVLSATAAFWLFYHRSAMSEGNYLFFSLLGLFLWWRGQDDLRRWSLSRGVLFALSGAAFGFGYAVNPSACLLMGCALVGSSILCATRRVPFVPTALGAAVLGLTAWLTRSVVFGLLSDYVLWDEMKRLNEWRAGWVLAFQPGPYLFWHLLRYTSPVTFAFALAGVGIACRRRSSADLVVLAMLVLVGGFWVRMSLPYPRVYLPVTVPFMLLACRAAGELARRYRSRAAALPLLCVVMAGAQLAESRHMLTLRSGYEQTCRILKADGVREGVSTHSWMTLQTFTARRFGFITEALQTVFERPDWRAKLPQALQKMTDKGATHMVIDYMFWTGASPQAVEGLRGFIEERPPTFAVPNSAPSYAPTVEADGKIPPLNDEPLAQKIYIYRLRDYVSPVTRTDEPQGRS